MSNTLRNTLQDLQTTVQNKDVSEANHLVNDIRSNCLSITSSAEIGLCCSLLFQNDQSLFTFLRKISHLNEFGKCQDNCLVFLQEFIPRAGHVFYPYMENVMETCMNVCRTAKLSANKEKAISIMIRLIELGDGKSYAKKLDVEKLRKLCNEELAKRSGTTSTVKSCCFHMLGIIAEYYPQNMINQSERMFDIYLRELKKEMQSQKTSDHKIIEGCLKGLSCLMINFTKSIDEDSDTCKEIYKFTMKSIQPKTDLSRYAVPAAGLQILQRHSSQFGHLLTDNYESIYAALQKWFSHNNPQMKHEAHVAISSFLHQIVSSVTEDLKPEQAKRLFVYFIGKFQEMLDTPDATSKILSIAIQGFGLFAGLCKKYMPAGDVQKMFSMMIERCEKIYLGETEISENKLHQLPSFLQSLANIVREMIGSSEDSGSIQQSSRKIAITESFERSLCQLCVLMLGEYPRLNKKFAKSCCGSLISLMSAFAASPDSQYSFVSKIVYQGLIRCCSHQVVLGDDRRSVSVTSIDEESYKDIMSDSRTTTYRDYISLWSGLICPGKVNTGVSFVTMVNKSERRTAQEMVYSELLSSIIVIISKLNLSAKNMDENENFKMETIDNDDQDQLSSNEASAENIVDFQVFVNLTDLCRDLLPILSMSDEAREITEHVFKSRASTLVKELIKQSTRFPVVSGFYKLLATTMEVCVMVRYFLQIDQHIDSESIMDVTDDEIDSFRGEVIQCAMLIKKFVPEVASHLLQWKDDLLASCLLFILSLPSELATDIMDTLILPLQTSFRLGLSYTLLAEAGMNAMERWRDEINSLSLIKTFAAVLPDIEPFLHSVSKQDNTATKQQYPSNKKKRSKMLTVNINADIPALEKVRSRAIKFLGSMGGLAHACLEKSQGEDSDKSNSLVVWDKDATIPYAVPFQELKTDIQLETLLPRIAELASQSAVRRVKVAACEVLHSLTVYIIGRNAQQDESIQKQNPVTGIYKEIFPIILKLACDVELVSKQLFEPLVMQMIHWFTNNRKYESPDTAVLLNAIINGLVDESDAALRDLSAHSVKEFLVWSIKQNVSSKDTARKNAKSLLKRLYNLAQHPSPGKRLGSATAFNHIYKVFREQETLVDEFTLELMVIYINSLAMSHNDAKAMGTQKACSEVLSHVQRIVQAKKEIFNKESKSRRIPPGFNQKKPVVISTVVEWLLNQCSRPQIECRHQCMQLFYSFVPLLPENISVKQWLKKRIETGGKNVLITCFEGGAQRKGISLHPQMMSYTDGNHLKSALNWFDLVLASLDCYTWVFQQRLLTPTEVFQGDNSNIFRCIDHILHDIARKGIADVVKNSDIFTPSEQDSFNESKCTVIVRILQFTLLMLRQYTKECLEIFPSGLWEKETLLGTVALCCINPSALGFNIETDVRIAEQLPSLTSEIVLAMSKYLPSNLKNNFVVELRNEIFRNGSLIAQLRQATSHAVGSNLISAYKILQQSELLPTVLSKTKHTDEKCLAKDLCNHVFNTLVRTDESSQSNILKSLAQSTIQFNSQVLQLALNIAVAADFLIQLIVDSTTLCDAAGTVLNTKHGQAFFSTYKSVLCDEVIKKSSVYIPLVTKCCGTRTSICATVLSEILEHLFKNRQLRKKHSSQVCKDILEDWDGQLSCLWKSSSASMHERSAALTIFIKVITLDSTVCKDVTHSAYSVVFEMFNGFVTSSTLPLSFKSQVLTLLSFFCMCTDDTRKSAVKKSIFELCSLHFPSRSNEFEPGSTRYDDYVIAVEKLLLTLELTGSSEILEVLISIMCREEHHILADEFQSTLGKCLKNVNEGSQKSVLEVPYKLFSDSESHHPILVKCRTIFQVFVPLISQCSTNTAKEFFTKYIGNIMQYILEDNQRYSNEKWKDQLEMKACCYKLVEIMFSMLPAEDFKTESSPIVQAFAASPVGAGSTKLLKTFMGKVVRDKNEDMTGESELLEERRKFHCAVYNAVIAAVICTQSDIKWFDAFLFCDNPKKKEFLFDNIIDKLKSYSFPVETDEPLEKRKKFISIRKTHRDIARAQDSGYQSVAYVSSLAGSSLSEDVNQFDNNMSRTLQERPDQGTGTDFSFKPMADDSQTSGGYVELEKDEINDHECMSNLISLLMHMHENAIGFTKIDENSMDTDQGPSTSSPPKWMTMLIRKFSSSPHLNVKIFIGKLITNCENLLRPYAAHFIAPMIKVILANFKKVNEAGDACTGIDQFAVDTVVTLLSWSSISIPKDDMEEKILTRALIEAMMKNIKHEKTQIVRHNLELLKTIIECWRPRISDLNTDIVFHQCGSTDTKSQDNFTGLQLLGALLANGLPPYTPSVEVDREVFFQRIFGNVLFSRKAIVDTASEVMGLSLKHLSEEQKETEGEIHDMAHRMLEKLSHSSKSGVSGFGVFVSSLHRISRHYSPAAELFLSRILFNLPKLPGAEMKMKCVDIICSCIDKISDLLAELKAKDFLSMLIHRDETLQHSCLKLCASLVQKTITWDRNGTITNTDDINKHQQCIEFFFPSVEKYFQSHPSPLCRQVMYDLAMEIYDIQKSFAVEHQAPDIIKTAKLILLRGLHDSEEVLRNQVVNFWSEENSGHHKVRLAADPAGKLLGLLGDLYQPETEESDFIASACNLLMQAASRSPDFERAIFEHPLSECVFQEVSVDHTWQHRHSTMNPMFVETMQSTMTSSSSFSPSPESSSGQRKPRMLQATQVNLQFSATVDVTGKNTYNWMTGGSVDTFSSLAVSGPERSTEQRESVLLAAKPRRRAFKSARPVGPDFGKHVLTSSNEGDDQHLDIARLRRRFQKETSSSQYQFARVAARKDREKQKHIRQENAKREHAVQLYRTYRLGELPDIEIPHRCVIAPLAALAQLDPVLSQRLLSSLIHAIINEQSKRSDEYLQKISEAFAKVLSTSQQCHSSFIGSVLDVILKNASEIKINPSIIAQAAVKSNQHLLGIRVIEEWLMIQQEPKEPSFKRRKLLREPAQISEDDMLAWIELARLYQKDFDTLRGIFTGTPVARPLFGEAIRFESECEFSKASKVYQKALIEEMDPEPSDVEKDLWEDCLLNCLKKLGRWQEVSDFCDAQTDNSLSNVWDNTNFQQRFLSTSLHAKMLLISRGNIDCGPELLHFVENSIKHGKERKNLIESKYSDHIAMLYINQEDHNQANFYIQKATNAVTEEWAGKESQSDMLSKITHLSDMTDFNDLMRQHQGKQISSNALLSLVDRWNNCLPHPLHDSVNVWEDMLAYRSYFLDHLVQNYKSNSSSSSQDDDAFMSSVCLQESIARKKLTLQLKSVENACSQKHYTMARKFLNDDVEGVLEYIRSLDGSDGLSEELFQQAQTTSKYYLSFAHHIMNVGNKCSDWVKASKAIVAARSSLFEEMDDNKINTDIRALKLLGQTYDVASDMVDRYVENETVRENLRQMLQDESCKSGVLKDDLRSHAQKYFEDGMEICVRDNKTDDNVAEIYWSYAKYCDKILQEKDENCGSQLLTQSNCDRYAENAVKFTLRAMKHHSGKSGREASLKFPRLLQLVDAYPDAKPCFLQETSQLSSWMFLQWTSQMVALLDKGEADAVHDIVSRLASEYPQAVIYPVKTSGPDFCFTRTETGRKNKCFVKKLQAELDTKVPIVEPFIKNLTLLTNPAHIFSGWYDETDRIYKDGGKSKNTKDIITKYQNMYNDMFALSQFNNTEDDDLYETPKSNSQNMSGNYRKNFANKFRGKVEKEFGGSTGTQLSGMEQKQFCQICSSLLKDMKEFCKDRRPQTLKEYSRWLVDFHSLNFGEQELEIPGQYKGRSKPMVEYHVKISGFEDTVRVMSSLQQPKRITIKASDSHEYQYLVKGNEDLRQDQRIQQVFEAMNKIFHSDQHCAKRNLHIDTYQVIPVTSRLGLIEWVQKTETLQDVVYEEARHINKKNCVDKAAVVYDGWLKKFSNDPRKIYGKMMETASHTDTCNKYDEVVGQVPQGLLRNAYLRLSSTPEAFLALRQKFASSYGTLCVAHWILGIGDRHTSNCMISKKTGAAVGIDFGHAFGTATECLPVPELVPFRLSPQICQLMAPHPAKHGVLRQCMVYSLAALRSEQETILAMLDVFLKEPSLDWMKFANKMVQVHGSGVTDIDYGSRQHYVESNTESVASSSSSTSNTQWYPRRKIGIVKRKLSGCKPSTMTEDELSHNYQVQKKLLHRYKAVVVGLNNKNLRAAYDNQNLSVDDQVDCLIDQATDPNILGRTFIGWRFWL